ncbi:hypothetical protein [Candidatus Sororendozoicomonas aggregata]|uniref:hypothetical protein n=1 Tax=Candidatus Sororendozoicomonas aggregata TaxID=3073239 RepID=UPI002ED40C4D
MNEVPTLQSLCIEPVINNGEQCFSLLSENSTLQKLYIRRLMFNFFGGDVWPDHDEFQHSSYSVPSDGYHVQEIRELLQKKKPVPFPFPELKDKTLYIHSLGDFGYFDNENTEQDADFGCRYMTLGTQEKILYVLISYKYNVFGSYEYYDDSNKVGCSYDVYSLLDYHQDHEALKVAAEAECPDPVHLACLIIHGLPYHVELDYEECTVTFP